jgi:hypothetical protein
MRRKIKPATTRFWAKVDKSTFLECWIWTAAKTFGYGTFSLKPGHTVRAHRFSYEQTYGPIPEGLQLDHLCRIRHCVNPEHLEAVTGKTNMERGQQARKTHCDSGHPFNVLNTRIRSNGTRRCRHCERIWARKYYKEKHKCKNRQRNP